MTFSGAIKHRLEECESRLEAAKESIAFYEACIAELHLLHEALEAAKTDSSKCIITRGLFSIPDVGRLVSRTKATVTVATTSGDHLVFNIRGWRLRGQKPMRGDVRARVEHVDLGFFGDGW